ncbi:MAG: peptidoglycan DD-metalloendopeptidase family protein [Hyphomicrobiaceae bacterium]
MAKYITNATSRQFARAALRGSAAALLCSAGPMVLPLAAQDATPASKQEAERSLELKRQELDAAESKEKALQDDVAGLDAERERINAQLLETAALIQRSEGQLTSIEGRLSELEAQERIVRGSLQQRHGQIAKLLAALQRMGRNPPPVLITRREDALKMVRSAMLIASSFPELKEQALTLSARLDDLVRVMTEIRQEGDRLRSETTRLNEARTRLSGLMEVKKLTLADRRSELASVRSATAEISRNVGDLAELIGKLDKTVSETTGLGSYNEELRKSAPIRVEPPPAQPAASAPMLTADITPATTAPAPVASAPAAAATVVADAPPEPGADPSKETQVAALTPPPRLKPQIIELAPSNAALSGASPGRIKPAIPFATAQAKLPLPAQGRRVLAFGEKTQYGAHSKGIVIETRPGAQITSPCDGWVVYAGEFRSYGQLLIINGGDGYHVLLAGMSQIDATPGQFVLAAEPVGTMAGAGRTKQGAAPPGSSVLYVEFRKDGRPIDPDPWWVAGQQKVQG